MDNFQNYEVNLINLISQLRWFKWNFQLYTVNIKKKNLYILFLVDKIGCLAVIQTLISKRIIVFSGNFPHPQFQSKPISTWHCIGNTTGSCDLSWSRRACFLCLEEKFYCFSRDGHTKDKEALPSLLLAASSLRITRRPNFGWSYHWR